jgi:NADPH-ferrihemoprotein reductase
MCCSRPTDGHSSRQYALKTGDFPEASVFTGEVHQLNALKNQRGFECHQAHLPYLTLQSPYTAKNPFLGKILAKNELYKGERSCLHMEIDLTGSNLRFHRHISLNANDDFAQLRDGRPRWSVPAK